MFLRQVVPTMTLVAVPVIVVVMQSIFPADNDAQECVYVGDISVWRYTYKARESGVEGGFMCYALLYDIVTHRRRIKWHCFIKYNIFTM